jgi:hypothetical protein
MAKNSVTDYDTTAANNTDVGGISIEGSDNVANFDNALREIMKQIADLNTGVSFIHDTYKIADSDAETKLAKFDASSITAGQTRTFTFPDKNGTFAMTSDVIDEDDFSTDSATRPASQQSIKAYAAPIASPTFTGDAEFSNITDGSTTVGVGYLVNGSAKAIASASYPSGVLTAGFGLNISSLTDVSSGNIDYNFTSAFDDTSFANVLGGEDSNYGNRAAFVESYKTTSKARTVFVEGNSTAVLDKNISVSFFGNF